ncbi:4-alpha-glucanotransferase [Streptomyces sp. ACA25]|uniref:4-alpha-glucanotransferase n=1 Tax=Streptomyces sp. ACA25 TaxID=3022596 RepID=UPI0023077947|nr:4-alpha-glucanotransferase [Streptomyces sp. ACA25]MDB1086737.1 4-alpha-glucanotransferase [Streptomyces sp. ACA25]
MSPLTRLAAAHGVATSYEPAPGRRIRVPKDTVVAVLAALGVDAATPGAVREALERQDRGTDGPGPGGLLPPTVVHRPGGPPALPPLPAGTTLRVETGTGALLDWSPPRAPLPGRPPAAGAPGAGQARPPVADRPPLPLGRHLLHAAAPDGRTGRATLIVPPARLPVPDRRSWGLLVQLYSVLSARSWGMGDLGDLTELADWAGRSLGAGFVQLNPLHAAVPGPPGEPTDASPYRPATRRFPDPVHLRVTDLPEFSLLAPPARQQAEELVARAARLRDAVLVERRPIDRDAVWELKRAALELVYATPAPPGRRAAYAAFLAGRDRALDDHATWCALAELHGPDWRSWPSGLRDPRSPDTARARTEHRERIGFHRWLAWLTDTQLARAQRTARQAGMSIGLVHDLAVGVHPHGSETWAQQHVLAAGMSTGAPPDAFNARGQDWGLPPWRPDALARAGYMPYQELLAGLLRHTGALRVDHVMGLYRLWWIPEGAAPTDGTYVSYDAEAILAVLALEAHRAGAVVVGEDLGTVEPGVREDLAGRGVLGTSVLWFERDHGDGARPDPLPPEQWRTGCLATVTTHDLPPTAARLSGDDLALRRRLGLLDGADPDAACAAGAAETAEWLALFDRLGLLAPGADEAEQIAAAYRFLTRTPALMTGVWLPDGVGDRRPQNVPGTSDTYPNWMLPVADGTGRPVTLEELARSPRVAALLRTVADGLSSAPVR